MSVDYPLDPALRDMPLNLSEVEELVGTEGKVLGKDPRRAHHFTLRVAATIRLLRQQIQQLHRDVQEIQVNRERAGTATTLSPLDAVRYLTDDQKKSVFGAHAQQQLEHLQRLQGEAAQAVRAYTQQATRITYAARALLEDPAISGEAKRRFQELVGPTTVPAERPDLAPNGGR